MDELEGMHRAWRRSLRLQFALWARVNLDLAKTPPNGSSARQSSADIARSAGNQREILAHGDDVKRRFGVLFAAQSANVSRSSVIFITTFHFGGCRRIDSCAAKLRNRFRVFVTPLSIIGV
jgi:hypothetical protein